MLWSGKWELSVPKLRCEQDHIAKVNNTDFI